MKTKFGKQIDMRHLIDSEACEKAVRKGYSRKLGYLPKHQRVQLSFVHDALSGPGCFLGHVNTDLNTSDWFTKALDVTAFRRHRAGLGILPLPELSAVIAPAENYSTKCYLATHPGLFKQMTLDVGGSR